jgi:hypothetical protein
MAEAAVDRVRDKYGPDICWLPSSSFEMPDGSSTGPSWGSLSTREPVRLPDGKV